ncbi:SEL1-like repeat protein [Streptomyces diastatochromogenes]|uniref:SEL1-like repeat protein n=1 Tax=Streptomyces diastatochromogenes TaxID=42236 RepID=UPI0011803E53|nr:SEL1-like repeat protein [Streptomyces diastatochromogenes]
MRLESELASVGADVLVARRGPVEWARVRKAFAAWFKDNGAPGYETELCVVPWPAAGLTELDEKVWFTRVRMTLDHAPDRDAAAEQLRALIEEFAPVPGPGRTFESGPEPEQSPPADHVDFRRGTFHGPVVGVQIQNTYGAHPALAHTGPADWPTAGELEPLTHGVRPARRTKGLPELPPYVERDVDGAVGSAVAEGGLVVVLGEPFAGKSRTALAALATVLPTARVYAPARHVDLRGLPDLLRGRPDRCVLWLDDLDGHLGDGGLEPRLLARLTGRGVVVLATLREDAYDEHRQTSRGRVLDLAQFVELPREWSQAERGRAAGAGDPRLAQAARHSGVEGVAAYLAVAPLLWEEWRRAGRPDRHPRGHALVRVAVDLARCGLRGPLPQEQLVELHKSYEAPAGLERETVEEALDWAAGERFGVLPLLRRGGPRGWEAVPCLVDAAHGDDGLPPLDGALWQRALEIARTDEAYDFATVAALARTAFRSAAKAGDATAMYRLGLLEEGRGLQEEAEDLFRRAAEAGVAQAAGRVGRLLAERGEGKEAEPFLERAAEAGDGGAATLLGRLLRDRAQKWLEAGAGQGDSEAQHLLADLLFTRTESEWLWDLYHRASAAGRTEVARSLGMWHLVWNSRLSGETWLRRAADAGDEEAADMFRYGGRPESLEDSLSYFMPSDTYPLDHAHYGALLEGAGRTDDARDHYRDGYEMGDSYAAYRLATLLEKQGKPDEAKTWYRKAADMGHPAALKALGEPPEKPDTVKE